eukprot:7299873-Pyramimonas_sp.AAC.1
MVRPECSSQPSLGITTVCVCVCVCVTVRNIKRPAPATLRVRGFNESSASADTLARVVANQLIRLQVHSCPFPGSLTCPAPRGGA